METEEADERISKLVDRYNRLEKDTIDDIPVTNITLKDALAKQLEIELKWQPLLSDVRSFKSMAKYKLDNAHSDAMNRLLTNSHRKHNITESRELSKCDTHYRTWRTIHLEAEDLYEDIKGIVDIIHSRRYVLNNMTNSIVSGVKSDLL